MRELAVFAVAVVMLAPTAQGAVVDHRESAADGADRLLETQLEDGAFPWNVESDAAFQNVQGVTAQGLLDAYKVTGNEAYLDAAGDNADWLADYLSNNPEGDFSAPNAYFLAEYALLTQNPADLDLARQGLQQELDQHGDARTLAENVLTFRKNTGAPNYGLWDVALFTRAAQDVGNTTMADTFASVLVEQAENATIVDPFDSSAHNYQNGLGGLLFGLAEADVLGHQEVIQKATDALKAEQQEDGFVPGGFYEGYQATAYAALGFAAVGELDAAHAACDWLVSSQNDDGSWTFTPAWENSPQEYGENDSESVQALSTCTLPARNGATAYANAAVHGI